jgi:hypothetical protein
VTVGSKETEAKTMRRKIFIWLLAIFLLTTVPLAQAQQPKKIARLGNLSAGDSVRDAARFEQIRLLSETSDT